MTSTFYSLPVDDVAKQLEVDPAVGLSAAEAQRRLQVHGPNRMAAKQKESGLHAFAAAVPGLHADPAARRGRGEPSSSPTTGAPPSCWSVLTVFNAVLGLRGESKAEESVGALEKMMKNIARVRRDGEAIEIDAEELVPGDIVLMEAGNRVPADGRLFVAATLEIEEAALTGESVPVAEGRRRHRRRPTSARRPPLHGLHEHLGHARPRRDDRHHHRHGHRDRPHRRHAQRHRGRQDTAAEAARPADHRDRQHRRCRVRPDADHRPEQRRRLRPPSSSPASHSPSRPSPPACPRW